MSNEVVIFGTGSFAEAVHFYLTHDSDYRVVAFTADKEYVTEDQYLGLPLVPFEEVEKTYAPGDFKMFVAVGYSKLNKMRAQKYEEAKQKGYQLISYVCSKSVSWGDTKIGDNCFIFENQTIQPFVTIGNDVVLWSGNHIGHCASIGDHCWITSHVVVSGHVKIGPYCFVGVNATIRDAIEIAGECIIGAGSLIMRNTKEKEVYVAKRTEPDLRDSTQINL
jgi:sugar O-acyltransferase (sialic acid O-acetyltransferase NeuD family)